MKKLLLCTLLCGITSAFGVVFKNATTQNLQLYIVTKTNHNEKPEAQTLQLAAGQTYAYPLHESAYACRAESSQLGTTSPFIITETLQYVTSSATTRQVTFIEETGNLKAVVTLEVG